MNKKIPAPLAILIIVLVIAVISMALWLCLKKELILPQGESVNWKTSPVNILSPNGGENIKAGETYTISWSSNNNVKNIIISLMQGNSKVYLISKSFNASLEKFDWKVDSTAGYVGRNDLRVILYDTAYCGYVDQSTGVECVKDEQSHGDASDNYFSIEK